MLNFETGLAIWTIITFLILLFILGKTAWPRILSALEEREGRIRTSLDEAEKAKEDAERMIAETKEMLGKAKKEVAEIVKQGAERAEKVREDLIEKAAEDAKTLVEKTKIELEREREKAIEDLKNRTVDLSVAIAARIISSSLTPEQQTGIARQAIKDMESGL